jgi:hypothetical protein
MNGVEYQQIHCPYCGESIEVVIDCSVEQQSYIEDCSVCCRPINFDISIDSSGELMVNVTHENE